MSNKLKEIDENVAKAIGTNRRESEGRSKASVVILDIWNTLRALGPEINVIPDKGIKKMNPESLLPNLMGVRMNNMEEQMKKLIASMDALSCENRELRAKIHELETELRGAPVVSEEASLRELPSETPNTEPEGSDAADTETAVGVTQVVDVQNNGNKDLIVDEPVVQVVAGVTPVVAAVSLTEGTHVGRDASSIKNKPRGNEVNGTNRHNRNLLCTNIGIAAAVEAAQIKGISKELAINIATSAASQVAKGYSAALKSEVKKNVAPVTPRNQQPSVSGTQKNANASTNKKRLPYSKGTGTFTQGLGGISLACSKPSYLKNKALVISRISRNITEEQFQQYVDVKAGEHVQFLYTQRLDRTNSSWGTVVVELSDSDFAKLANPDFWQDTIQIKEWRGWRFWRGSRPTRVSQQERKNLMRSQWAPTATA